MERPEEYDKEAHENYEGLNFFAPKKHFEIVRDLTLGKFI